MGEGPLKARETRLIREAGAQHLGFSHFRRFSLGNLYRILYKRYILSADLSKLRQQLWRAYAALANTLRRLQRSDPMVQGSFYLLQRKCGKPNCRCATGQLHPSYVLTRSEAGKDRLYTVPKEQRAQVRKWAAEYRRYQRARAVLTKRHLHLLALVDQMAEQRLLTWPPSQEVPHA